MSPKPKKFKSGMGGVKGGAPLAAPAWWRGAGSSAEKIVHEWGNLYNRIHDHRLGSRKGVVYE